jgi:dolichol-phosphate mannosyltransferase
MRSWWWTTAARTAPGPSCRNSETTIPTLAPVQNLGLHGFGRAVICGLNHIKGDACVIMMADASDSPEDAVKYWRILNEGLRMRFGSRFIKGGG